MPILSLMIQIFFLTRTTFKLLIYGSSALLVIQYTVVNTFTISLAWEAKWLLALTHGATQSVDGKDSLLSLFQSVIDVGA